MVRIAIALVLGGLPFLVAPRVLSQVVETSRVTVRTGDFTELLDREPLSQMFERLPAGQVPRALWADGEGDLFQGEFQDGSTPPRLTSEPVELDVPVDIVTAVEVDPITGAIRAIVTADHNARELRLEGGSALLFPFGGLADFYAERPVFSGVDLDGDGVWDVRFVAVDHAGPNTIELFSKPSGAMSYGYATQVTGAANPYFHRRAFDFAATDKWKAFSYWQLPQFTPTVEFRPMDGGAAVKVPLGETSPTPPAGTVAPISVLPLVEDYFFVAWQGAQNKVRGAIVSAERKLAFPYDLGNYGNKGVLGLDVHPTIHGPLTTWVDAQTLSVRASLATLDGTALTTTPGRLDQLSAGALTNVKAVQFHFYDQPTTTQFEGTMFVTGGGGLYSTPFTIGVPGAKRRSARQ